MKLTRSSSVLGDATTAPVGTQPPRPPVEGLPSSDGGRDTATRPDAIGGRVPTTGWWAALRRPSRRIKTLQDVVDWGLCTGCGACYYACSKKGVSLVNIESVGIRPRFEQSACAKCTECLSICPGYTVDGELAVGRISRLGNWESRLAARPGRTLGLPSGATTGTARSVAEHKIGPALEIWEGYASDPEIRFQGSSGGALTALALYCLERENMEFVLHTGADEAKPWLNRTVQSRNRSDLLARTGSRYAPASPCDSLELIEKSSRPCVFIGKPCDTAAVTMLRQQRPGLDQNLGLVLTFFCAGTPSTQGTLDLVKTLDVPLEEVGSVRYRGEGWPGRFTVRTKPPRPSTDGLPSTDEEGIKGWRGVGSPKTEKSISYMQSWGRLAGYWPLRCHLCPDGLGRVADISCGDAWERLDDGRDAGRSILVVRTRRGQEILHKARAANYLELEPVGASAVLAAQPIQTARNREIWGRLLGMRLLLVPTPKFVGFSLFRLWWSLPILGKARKVLGTMRRVVFRGMWRRRAVDRTVNRE